MNYGQGSVYLRGGTWWVKYYRAGQPSRESSHSCDRTVAERLLAQRTQPQIRQDFICPNCGTAVTRVLRSA